MEELAEQIKQIPQSHDDIIRQSMHQQAVINLGTTGHVSNGKTTLTKNLTGVATQKSKEELVRNMTIKLGYANVKIYKCNSCEAPECYQPAQSHVMTYLCAICNGPTELITHISITDVPGHNSFMTTMLNGTCVMDYAMLVESCVNTKMPAEQTIEHYKITKEVGIPTVLVCLNKVDLMMKFKQKIPQIIDELRQFTGGAVPVIPVSGTMGCNIDVICEHLAKLAIPKKDLDSDFKMFVIRSFNVNHPNTKIMELKGGVLGGSLTRGIIRVGDNVLVFPGFVSKKPRQVEHEIEYSYMPLRCKVLSINSEKNNLQYAIPGGNVGVQLDLDPGMTYGDHLVGHLMFKEKDDMSHVKVYEAIKIKHKKLEGEDHKIKKGDSVLINVNSNKIDCKVYKVSSDNVTLLLDKPICVEIGDKVTINIPLGSDAIHIYGYGEVVDGAECNLMA